MISSGGIVGNAGGPYKTESGALNVHDADVHHVIINEFFHRMTGVTTTLTAAASAGDKIISVVDASLFLAGDTISIMNGVEESVFPIITSISVNDITIDQPLDNGYSIGDDVNQLIANMAVNGSVTPVSFKLHSERGETWHIVRILLSLVHGTAADDGKFGNLAKLTNGVVLRGYNGVSDTFRTLTNWKENADIKLDMFDVIYTDKAAGGAFGTNARGSMKAGAGAVPRVTPVDYLEILIQDDLTGLTDFRLKAQGHIEGN